MLKQSITYTDFNDEQVTDILYFNLTKSEIVEMEADYDGGLEATIKRIVETKDNQGLIREFKRLILKAYGEKSEDGKRFIKSDAIREAFQQTAAYDAMFMQLATSDAAAVAFMRGVMPKDLAAQIAQLENETPTPPTPQGLPTPPAPSV